MMAEQAAQSSGASVEFQRLTWEALRKSINGLINKVNVANIKFIVPDLFGEKYVTILYRFKARRTIPHFS